MSVIGGPFVQVVQVISEPGFDVLTGRHMLEEVTDASRGANGDRIAAVELRVVEVELRQFEQDLKP